MKIDLVLTDGVGYRNFILGRFLSVAVASGIKVRILTSVPLNELNLEGVEIVELKIYKENRIASFFRKVSELSHFVSHRTDAMNYSLKRIKETPIGFSLLRNLSALYIAKIFHFLRLSYLTGIFSEYIIGKCKLTKAYSILLSDYKPDLVFVTHQRPPQMAPYVLAAKCLRIKTASFIFSWDNLTSKGRIPVVFDYYFVWSDLMKSELLKFYPKTNVSSVFVCGTPQFEIYDYPEYGYSQAKFYSLIGISADFCGKIITYSCGDLSTSPNDPLYISILASWIIENNKTYDFILLVRTSPAETPSRFEHLKRQFPFILWNFPDWKIKNLNHPEPWSQRVPSIDDMHYLKSLLMYSDVNINMCSTMSLDFSLFDKPVINPVLGTLNNKDCLFPDQIYLNYEHYRNVVDTGAVYIARTKDELIKSLQETLEFPQFKTQERKVLIHLEVGLPLKGTSERMVKNIHSIVSSKH